MRLSAATAAAVTDGALRGPDVEFDGATIDSRVVEPGQLFVAVVAERDGHDWVADAVAAGAAACLTSAPAPEGTTAVEVDDTTTALRELGAHARTLVAPRVIGVTGSVGKTTVKDLLAGALESTFRTGASARSFNNELGVPLTLLNAPDDAEAVVVEMGARGLGHIAALCDVAQPTIGVVTTVALGHTEQFGSLDEVARGKGELIEHLPASGTAVLNAQDPLVAAMADRTAARVLHFGVDAGDVRAGDVVLDGELRARFTLHTPWGAAPVQLAVRGAHQVANAAAAAAAALAAGAELKAVADGLGHPAASPWRMQLERSAAGALVLNDAYNANPASMRAALRALAALDARRRVAVLGVMAELGDHHGREHDAVAAEAARLGIRVLAVGTDAYGGEVVPDVAAAVEALGPLGEGDAVLVKASRVAGLERLAAALLHP